MNTRVLMVACIFGCGTTMLGAAQETSAAAPSRAPERLRAVAVRWEAPGDLSRSGRRELDATLAAAKRKQIDEALGPWRALLARENDRENPFNPKACVDYVLNCVAVSRSPAAEEACRRLRHYDAQESAILEHVTTAEKHLSAYGEDHVSAAPLREPELGSFEDGADPVTLAPGASVGGKELQESLTRWQQRLPAISEAREAAIAAFVKAITDDHALAKEIQDLEAALAAEIATPAANVH